MFPMKAKQTVNDCTGDKKKILSPIELLKNKKNIRSVENEIKKRVQSRSRKKIYKSNG